MELHAEQSHASSLSFRPHNLFSDFAAATASRGSTPDLSPYAQSALRSNFGANHVASVTSGQTMSGLLPFSQSITLSPDASNAKAQTSPRSGSDIASLDPRSNMTLLQPAANAAARLGAPLGAPGPESCSPPACLSARKPPLLPGTPRGSMLKAAAGHGQHPRSACKTAKAPTASPVSRQASTCSMRDCAAASPLSSHLLGAEDATGRQHLDKGQHQGQLTPAPVKVLTALCLKVRLSPVP